MPKARSTKLLVLAIACTALTMGLVAAWGVSVWCYAGRFDGDDQNSMINGAVLMRGCCVVFWQDPRYTANTQWVSAYFWKPSNADVYWHAEFSRGQVHRFLSIPLWLPVAPALPLTCLAWRAELRSRQPARAGLCPTCRYDLAATPTGAPCPECGTPTSTAVATNRSAAAGRGENADYAE